MHRNYHYIIIGTCFYANSVTFKACFCLCCFKCVNVHTRTLSHQPKRYLFVRMFQREQLVHKRVHLHIVEFWKGQAGQKGDI